MCESSDKAIHEGSELHLKGRVVHSLFQPVADINLVSDRLYISDGETSQCKEFLDQNGITHIINMTQDLSCKFTKDFKYIWIPIDDYEDEDIGAYFDEGIKFIRDALKANKKNRVLVHCWAGVSRSAAMVVAYLIKKHKITFFEAIDKVRTVRYI